MTDALRHLRLQAEAAAALDIQRDRLAAVLDVWTEAVLPLLADDGRTRWRNALLLARSALYTLDLSRDEDRKGLLCFVEDVRRIGLACSAPLSGAELPN